MTKNKWLNRWIVSSMEQFHFCMAGICIVLCVAAEIAKKPEFQRAAYFLGFFLIVHFLLHKNLHAHYSFLAMNREVDRLPVSQMKQVNGVYIGLFLGILSVMLGMIPFLHTEEFWGTILGGVLAVVRWLLHFFKAKEVPQEIIFEEEVVSPSRMQELGGIEDPSWFVRILDFVATFAGYCLMAALFGWILYQIYQKLRWLFRPRVFDDDEKVFLKPEVLSDKVKRRSSEREKRLWMDFSYNGKVRKYYKKMVKQKNNKKQQIPSFASPTEIEQLVGFSEADAELHVLYEKARYSEHGCVKADVEKSADAGKRLSGKA